MKHTFKDQLERTISINYPPKRIISLVPSQSELLAYLGLEDRVVGITKFCIHPERQFRSKTRIGGTKQLKFDTITRLQPDLIIGNKEENEQGQIERLAQDFPVWMSDIENLDAALEMIDAIGQITNTADKAATLVKEIEEEFEKLTEIRLGKRLRAAYFIWRKPYMVVAGSTFINDMLEKAGFENVFATAERYPEVHLEQVAKLKPDVLLLSSEPFPFAEKHLEEFRHFCPEAVISLVDGELFSWYGNRLLHSATYFRNLYHRIIQK